MAKRSQWGQVGKRAVELSNLEKILFPDENIMKAEVIEYYLKVAPTLLHHVKAGRLRLYVFPTALTAKVFTKRINPTGHPIGSSMCGWVKSKRII